MTVFVQQYPNNGSFGLLFSLVNLLSNAMSNSCVTTNSNTAIGNAAISGSYFSGNSTVNATFSYSSLNFSNTTVNFNFTPPTAAQISGGGYVFSSNGWISGGILTTNTTIQTSGLGSTLIDTWLLNQYISAKYLVTVQDNAANNFYASELLVLTDGVNGYVTEYSQIFSNSASLGTFSASSNSTNFLLNFTPTSTSTSIRFSRQLI